MPLKHVHVHLVTKLTVKFLLNSN